MKYTRQTMTRAIALELIEEHGSAVKAAKAIYPSCAGRNGEASTPNAVRQWIQELATGTRSQKIFEPSEADRLNKIKELLDENNIDVNAIGRIDKVRIGKHAVVTKDNDGVEHVTEAPNISVEISPAWADGPKWPVVQAAKPAVVKYNAPTIIIPRGLRVEVVSPDTQIGYRRELNSRTFNGSSETFTMTSMHDEDAIDVSTQIIAAVQPDGFTQLGDLFDFSEFSRYLQVEEFWRTTQSSIDYAHSYLARTKSAMGKPRRRRGQTKVIPKQLRLVDGNHDWRRIATYIQQNARAAFGLRPAHSTPESWPDLSVPHLLRLDELGFEHMGMWPGSEAWLVEGPNALVVVHDPKKKGFYQASVVSGHTHHHREETFTVRTPLGLRTFTHYEIGCLCSLEIVKAKGSIQRTAVPSDRGFVSNWTQGVAVIEILEDTGKHQLSFVRIENGEAIFRGQRFTAAKAKAKAA